MILVGKRWRLRAYDRRNWTLDEWASPTRGRDKGGEPRWIHREEYFQSVGQALSRVFEYELRDCPDEYSTEDVASFLDKVREIAAELSSVEVS